MRENDLKQKITDGEAQKLGALLASAILRADEGLVEKRLAQGASPSAASGSNMRTPLMVAACSMSLSMIERMLPFSDEAAVDADGNTALNLLILQNGVMGGWAKAPEGWQECIARLASPAAAGIKNRDGNTPLMTAALSWSRGDDQFKILLGLLLPMVDVWETNNEGQAACLLAAQGRSHGRALALWEAGRPSASTKSVRGIAHAAAKSGLDEFLREIAFEVDLEERDSRGRTPFLAAADKRSLKAAVELLKKGANPWAVDDDGCDAMMLISAAVRHGKSGMGFNRVDRDLLGAIAVAADVSARDFLGESALDKARSRRQGEIVEILLSTGAEAGGGPAASLPSLRPKLQEMLIAAVLDEDANLVEKRLSQGASPFELLDGERGAALGVAAADGNIEMIRRLLAQEGSGRAAGKEEALWKLVESSRARESCDFVACASELACAEAVAASNNWGRSPLMEASCYEQHFKELLALLGPLSDWQAKDKDGTSLVEMALIYMEDGNAMDLWQAHPDKRWAGASRNNEGQTLAHIAAEHNNEKLLEAIANHSDFSARDARGQTPLMRACFCGRNFERAVKCLAPWSDCRAVDGQGCDALMLAIEGVPRENYGHFVEAISELVRWADLGARDFLGESALDKALDRGFPLAVAAIQARMAINHERAQIAEAAGALQQVGAIKSMRI